MRDFTFSRRLHQQRRTVFQAQQKLLRGQEIFPRHRTNLVPQRPPPLVNQPFNLLGRAYLAMDRLADAEQTYERAATFASPGDRKQLAGAFGFEGVGDGYTKTKQKENAARAYQRAMELDPGNKTLEQKLSQARSR